MAKICVFDGHCDTISQLLRGGHGTLVHNDMHIDLERTSKYTYAQFFAAFASARAFDEEGNGYHLFLKMKDQLMTEIANAPDMVMFCKTAADAKEAAKQGKTAAFLSVEGAGLLNCCPKKLAEAYDFGVRAVNITWNDPNVLSGTNQKEPERGLSEKGKKFVQACNRLGVIVDVSHLSDPGFWDVIETSTQPIMASHSNSRAVFNHTRNLTDDMFKALIKNGGVAGFNMYTDFIGENATIDTCIEHMEHFLALGGEKNVAIGGDLDGCRSLPEGINGVQDVYKIYEALLKKNYSEDLVRDIFYNNMMRVVEEVCGI